MIKYGSGTKKMRQRQKWEQADKQSERKTCRQTDRRDFPSINKNKQKKKIHKTHRARGKKNIDKETEVETERVAPIISTASDFLELVPEALARNLRLKEGLMSLPSPGVAVS